MNDTFHSVLLEVCVDSLASALAAEEGGASRIELCKDLDADGCTPARDLIKDVRAHVSLPLHVLIRPRTGNFLYTEKEVVRMVEEICMVKDLGADGVVIGACNEDGGIDVRHVRQMVYEAQPLSVTFHRAFDACHDMIGALHVLVDLEVDRILSSGGKRNCVEGVAMLQHLVSVGSNTIVIMPGGGLSPDNARVVAEQTRAREMHTARGVSRIRRAHEPAPPGASRWIVEAEKVRQMAAALANSAHRV